MTAFDDPRRHGVGVPTGGICSETGKRIWYTRKDAKRKAKRAHRGEHAAAYRCDHCGGWHIGHLPKGVSRGLYTREQLRTKGEK